MILRALLLAARAHKGQVDAAGKPYLWHLIRVALRVAHRGRKAMAAGLLHDIVEDTHITLADLHREGFPADVVDAVNALTHRPAEPYLVYVANIRAIGGIALWVKRADNADNASERRLAQFTDRAKADRLRQRYANARALLA